jgi:crotonobetainyl-CoA:carnitine CoA-transferase CaiB-like acyl-CoA transferase
MSDASRALAALWTAAGGEAEALSRARLTGNDPVVPSDFRIGTAASAAIAATALAATEIERVRGARPQAVRVDLRAAVAAFKSERFVLVNGRPPADPRGEIFGFHRTGDGRFIQLHGALPHHRDGIMAVLGCEDRRDSAATAVATWRAQDLEDALNAKLLPAGMVRTRDEWRAHPHGLAIAALPLFEIVKIADGPPQPLPALADGARPLTGLRMLDLTRVIAGPVNARTLASYGADVLHVASRHLPNMDRLVIDTGMGKLATMLDLRTKDDAARLRDLVRTCDVFSQGYRPDTVARLGFGPEELASLRPGLVYVSLSAYGHAGPWRARRGFETLIQSVSGMAHEQGFGGGLDKPQHLPAQVVDHATGYLGAFGALMALKRRATEGGSWLVRISLAQTGRWVDDLGRVNGRTTKDLGASDVDDLMSEMPSPFGTIRYVKPAATFDRTPAAWTRPSVPLGTDPAAWP